MKKIALVLAVLMLVFGCIGCDKEEKGTETGGAAAATGEAASRPSEEIKETNPELCEETDDGKHQYEEELVGEPTCVEPGLMMYSCMACGYSTTKEIPASGHQGSGASCEEPSVCTVCWEIAEEAWGHQADGDVCKNCGIFMTEPEVTIPAEQESTESTVEATTEVTEER